MMKPMMTTMVCSLMAAGAVAAPTAAAPTDRPVVRIEAQAPRGVVAMKRLRDSDGFYYIRNSATNEAGAVAAVTNAVTLTVTPKEAGEWYVFARVRVGATKPLDQDAALFSLVGTNGEASASLRIAGSPGDESWQVVCLGKGKLEPKMALRVESGTGAPLRFLDVRDFLLMKPRLIETSMSRDGK